MTEVKKSLFPGRTAAIVVFTIICLILIWLLYTLRIMIIDLILAMTIASAISPMAERAETRKIPRAFTVVATFLAVILFYSAAIVALAQPVKEQAHLFTEQMPVYLSGVDDTYHHVLELFGEKAEVIAVKPSDWRTLGLSVVNKTVDITSGIIGLVVNSFFVLFLAAYFVIDAENIWNKLLLWVPPDSRQRVRSLIRPLATRMGGYVRGQILVSTAVATFLAVGLSLLGVRYGLVLGLLAGILNLMPFVGSLITAVLSVIVATNQSPLLAVLTIGLFMLEQAVESNLIVPQLLGKQVDLHPLIVLFAIIIGATLGGALGAIVAVPLASAALFLADEFYVQPLNAPSEPEVAAEPGSTEQPPVESPADK